MKATSSTRPHAGSLTRRLRAVLVVGVSLATLVAEASSAFAAGSSPYFTASGLGTIANARQHAVAAPLPNGAVLIAGGTGQKTAELFNPATGLRIDKDAAPYDGGVAYRVTTG